MLQTESEVKRIQHDLNLDYKITDMYKFTGFTLKALGSVEVIRSRAKPPATEPTIPQIAVTPPNI